MQITRRHATGMAVLAAFMFVATGRANAAPATVTSQDANSLLGIRLLDSYKTVLKRFGQPSEIQVGVPIEPEGGAGGAGGGMPGSGGPMGMPGSGGPMGMPGSSGGQMGPALPGFGGPSGGRPMGMPGSSGGPMGMPGSSGGPMGGAANSKPGTGMMPVIPGTGGGSSEETIWWYKYVQRGIFLAFILNKQGQVIQIQAHGYKLWPDTPNARTSKGVTLGASMGAVIRSYGWSNEGEHTGEYVVMRYDNNGSIRNGHGRLVFQVLKNQVVGITIGFVK